MIMETILTQTMLDETSSRQFKVDVKNAESLASEMATFANADRGIIFIGVADDGMAPDLSQQDVKRDNQFIIPDVLTALHDIYCLNCGNINIPRSRDLAGAEDMVRTTIWGILRMNGEMT